jgi:hypothetical protein
MRMLTQLLRSDRGSFVAPASVADARRMTLNGAYRTVAGEVASYDFALERTATAYVVRLGARLSDPRDEWRVIASTAHALDTAFHFSSQQLRDALTRERPHAPWYAIDDGELRGVIVVAAADVAESTYGGPAPFDRYVERVVGTLPLRGPAFLRVE